MGISLALGTINASNSTSLPSRHRGFDVAAPFSPFDSPGTLLALLHFRSP